MRSRRCRSCRARWRRRVIEQAGSAEQRERWLPGLASGETIGALGERRRRHRGARDRRRRGGRDRARRRRRQRRACWSAQDAEVSPVAAIDPTRSAARVSAATTPARAAGDVCRRPRPRAGGGQLRARRRLRAGAGDDRRVRQGPQAVRRPGGRLPGGLPPLRADAAGHREGALDRGLRRMDAPTPTRTRLPEAAAMAKAAASRRRARSDGQRDPGPRRHRLHLGGRRALAVQARAARRRDCSAARRATARAWRRSSPTGSPPRPRPEPPTARGRYARGCSFRERMS